MDFVDTCFTDRADVNVFRYSATDTGLQNSNQFRFENAAVKVNCIYIYIYIYSICSGLA
jgi:hypothetical protein